MLGLSRVHAIFSLWKTNVSGVDTLNRLFSGQLADRAVSEVALEESCSNYVAAIEVFESPGFQALTSESKLHLLKRYNDCLEEERRPLLARWMGDPMWSQGRYDEVCDLLVFVNSPDKLLRLGQQAVQEANWSAVESVLNCIPRFDPNVSWVSPFIVSQLYFALGDHFDQIGAINKAIAAFDNSTRWFPVVWSSPYMKKAGLLWDQGDRRGAIDWLVNGVAHSSDVTATYNLWRALGEYWQELGELDSAYCAYLNALGLIEVVPPENVSPVDRTALTEVVRQLSSEAPAKCFEQYPVLSR